jgi:predicted enzyme related to lactoylglutathione lyase
MIREIVLCGVACVSASVGTAQEPRRAPAPVVFFDVAGPDRAVLSRFYSNLFAWNIGADGTFTTGAPAPLPAALRQDPAATVVYIGVDDVTATLKRVTADGGSIVFPRLEVPGRVVIGMFKDPAGNNIGLVELKDGKPRIP